MNPTKSVPAAIGEIATGKYERAGGYSTDPSIARNPALRQVGKNPRLAWALRYAMAGYRVVPNAPGTKKPLITDWVTCASDNLEQVAAWWQKWPTANIGLALDDNLAVFDVDPRHGGELHHLDKLGVDFARAPLQHTPHGGQHVMYQKPPSMRFDPSVPTLDGLEVKTTGAQILVEPSEVDGKQYRWERSPFDLDIPRLALSVCERLEARKPTPRTPHEHGAGGGYVDLELVEDALQSLDPWAGGYHWWLKILMAIHSEYPGLDGQKVAVAWACGKPGEVERLFERYLKSDGNRSGKVGIGTLFYEAKLAGWVRPATGPVGLPWSVTQANLDSCKSCSKSYTGRLDDGSVVHGRDFCRNPKCQVKHKLQMGDALRVVLSFTGIRTETVPGMVWREWRENMRKSGRRYLKIPMVDGNLFCLVEVATPTPAAELQALLGVAAELWEHKPKRQNVSHEHKPKPAVPVDAPPPKPRAKLVERWFMSEPEQRRALQDALKRLGVPFERRAYGGWRTAPLDDETRDLLHLELLTVPGLITLAPTTSISHSGTTCELDALGGGELPHTEAEAALDAVRNRYQTHHTSPLKRSKRLSRAKRAADGKKRAALNAALRSAEARTCTHNRACQCPACQVEV